MKIYIWFIAAFIIDAGVCAQTLNGSFESKFKRYTRHESFRGAQTQHWDAVAWKGERIHKQIVLWSSINHDRLEYSIGAFKNVDNKEIGIASDHISLRFPSYVKGDIAPKSCSTVVEGHNFDSIRPYIDVADALIETPVTRITAKDPVRLWLTINIPGHLPGGNYEGTVVVSQNKKELKTFRVSIEVLEYQLPEPKDWKFHLDIWQWPLNVLKFHNFSEEQKVKAWSKEHFELLQPFYKVLADMGQKVICTQLNEKVSPLVKWIKHSDGTWTFDFKDFDSYVLHMRKWGIGKQISCHSMLGSKKNDLPYYKDNTLKETRLKTWSPEYNDLWVQFLEAFKRHLIQKGWFENTVLYFDEFREENMNRVLNFIQELDPDWKLGMAYGHVQSKRTMDILEDGSGILGVTNNSGRKDKINTFYTSCTEAIPNNYITPKNNVAEMAWMPWHTAREGLDGYLRWAFDLWTKDDPFDTRDGAFTSGDFSMIYRSQNGKGMRPVMGIRTEMLREGIQDYEKIRILRSQFLKNKDHMNMEHLERILSKFSASSGVYARMLVEEAQELLVKLSLGEAIEGPDMDPSEIHVDFNNDFNQMMINIPKAFFEVEILTYSGKRILLQEHKSPVKGCKIDLSNLQPDFYLIRITTHEETFVKVVYIPSDVNKPPKD